ncbi:MAG: AAA family ATPase [Gammaproteobacteria bacterium]|nr:AAA family ATPase [Gammaproteobacteria bacterium]
MINQCIECNHENRESARFCAACGASLPNRCPGCGAVSQQQADFCDTCGASLKNSAAPASADRTATKDSAADLAGSDAERRHLTVLFCDLVGSTNLSEHLDPEDFRELLAAYQHSCATVVSHYDGQVARYVGDGLLIYFGYPQAHEDDAPRALRAALDIVEAVGKLDLELVLPVEALAVRIGIATGTVVVGDIGTGARREEMAVVGETPNLAARLQTLAGPGEVLIAAQTRELVEGYFDIDDLGAQDLKGISQQQSVYRVRAESGVLSRLDASAIMGLTPLVGRREEIAILFNRWSQTLQGELQIVALSGEAGIGKSRVVRAFRDRLADEPHSRVLYYGSAYHQNSGFYPVIDQFARALRIENDDSVELRLKKLNAEVSRLGLEFAATVPPLAALLSLTTDDQNPSTPEGDLKRRQLIAICSVLEAISVEVPLLIMVEDAHWLDPSTLELLDAIGERLIHARVLIVMTHRPEFTFSTGSGAHLTQIPLSHLGRQESIAIVTRVAGNKPLPDEVAEQIIAKTGGIPLFVEELTKSLLESGVLRDDGKRFVLDDPLPPLAIPPSLQDSLMARLDRLAATKDIAQLAACIGRNFGLQLLSVVAGLDEVALHSALDQLVEAGLIHERGMPPDITYEFKHALVRDAAYDSLLKSTRQLNHQRIAQTLEQDFKSLANTQPELVAQHYTEAGLAEPAVTWWQRAGEKSAKLDARLEAIQHLERGLELLSTLDRSEARARIEVDMLMVLGNAIRVTEGNASERAEELFMRSRSICEWLGDRDREFPALWGMWSVAMARGALAKSTKQARNVLVLAQEMGKPDLELEGHHTLWGTFSLTGDLAAARHHAERGIEIYRFEQHGDYGFVYGNHDPGVCARYTNAAMLWLLGYVEQARVQVEDSIVLIGRHTQSVYIAHGLMHCCMPYMLLGDTTAVREILARVQPLAIETTNQGQTSECEFTLGWALAVDGEYANAIAQMEGGLADQPPAASRYYYCYFLSILADACYASGQFDKGQYYLHQAIEEANASGERWWEAELHRLEGHAHLLTSSANQDGARKSFQLALDVSRAQGAKMLELRATTDLSSLLRDQGDRRGAFDLLTPVYEWFTEGFDSTDLREAKALLVELS